MIVILGHTAGGKTTVAVNLANEINGEIISADSRQVYRQMDIGTGKDLAEYTINNKTIPYHLIDIVDPGYQYNVYEYQKDFKKAYQNITQRGTTPILSGGTGLYIESILNNYHLTTVPINESLREELKDKTLTELSIILKQYKTLHNQSDTDTTKRAIRAIEIAKYTTENQIETNVADKPIEATIFGINFSREIRRERITQRLHERLKQGMIDEVSTLIKNGVTPEQLMYYGLEYKYITQYLIGELSYDTMVNQLNIAIHQFAKRQMTWFRKMENDGKKIHWIDGNQNLNQKLAQIREIINSKKQNS